LPRFAGWWGHNKAERFRYDPKFDPIEGAQGWQISNPPILSTAPLLASLQIFEQAGMAALRKKSVELTGFMQRLIEQRLAKAIEIITPAAPEQRGCQLSLRIARPAAQAKRCLQRLTSAGVIGDWREPDVLRLAPIPLYNSFADVFAAVEIFEQALQA
jgi:kynureninase